jgi:hypothetical protein
MGFLVNSENLVVGIGIELALALAAYTVGASVAKTSAPITNIFLLNKFIFKVLPPHKFYGLGCGGTSLLGYFLPLLFGFFVSLGSS